MWSAQQHTCGVDAQGTLDVRATERAASRVPTDLLGASRAQNRVAAGQEQRVALSFEADRALIAQLLLMKRLRKRGRADRSTANALETRT
eukprot:545098-Pleurochrysis_carterae.AAC.1